MIRSCLLLTFISLSLNAQQTPPDSIFVVVRDGQAIADDGSELYERIGNLDAASFRTIGLVTLGAAAVQASFTFSGADDELRLAATKNHTTSVDNIIQYPNYYGTGGVAFSVLGSLYIGGLIAGNEGLRTSGRLILETFVVAGLTTTILKSVIGRARPYTNLGSSAFRPLSLTNEFYSLPSGHSSVAFAVSSVLARRIDNIYASIGLYALASSTAYARMYYDMHWLSDVVLGAAIGIASADLVVSLTERKSQSNSSLGFILYPSANSLNFSLVW